MSLAPPFTRETANAKVKKAQDLWNTRCVFTISDSSPLVDRHRNPQNVSKAYTEDSVWRNRDKFLTGQAEIVEFLTAKWNKEKNYRLRKELFAWTENRIAVQFWYEYQDSNDGLKWKRYVLLYHARPLRRHMGKDHDARDADVSRCYGLEDWTFAQDGRMRKRQMSGNDVEISEAERWFTDGVDVNSVDISEKHW
ncbi:DUF1348-domain-containing protein [Teratosphaeria destructans]|uniref:DUF1348-domain-containing protein n=1 Tax=Teratosphaeria destructans TaxID=418781 RepID=A0A9W7T1V6_9PEZI|nr:DUF1348-domain-containing protein [Teratosphaeria destructans]